MKKKSSSLKRFIPSLKTSLLGILFIVVFTFLLYGTARAKEPIYGHPVQRTTVADVTCTKIRDGDKTNFLVASKEESNLTYKKISDCLKKVAKSKFILVPASELNFTSRISAKFEGITCLQTNLSVISFSGDIPPDLELKIEDCFTEAEKIYDYKNNSMSWV